MGAAERVPEVEGVARIADVQDGRARGHLELAAAEEPLAGLQIDDTCFYYPEDRGISESVRFGRMMAERIA